MKDIYSIYIKLFDTYGPQGWWPLVGHGGVNPTKTGVVHGYHPGDYSFPHMRDEIFEICLGCFLTQNTSWTAVEKSLLNLKELNVLSPGKIMELPDDVLKEAIRPSGYNNQKARYIKNFTPFFLELQDRIPSRDALLDLVGIGPETADSILLYAFGQPEFVVDTYTKRIFIHLELIDDRASYECVKNMCEVNMQGHTSSREQLVQVYQEFHALLVEHAKRYYGKKPYGIDCFLKKSLFVR